MSHSNVLNIPKPTDRHIIISHEKITSTNKESLKTLEKEKLFIVDQEKRYVQLVETLLEIKSSNERYVAIFMPISYILPLN